MDYWLLELRTTGLIGALPGTHCFLGTSRASTTVDLSLLIVSNLLQLRDKTSFIIHALLVTSLGNYHDNTLSDVVTVQMI